MKYLLSAFVLICSACATVYDTPVRGPNGRHGYSITCKKDITECYAMAGKRCPSGYDLIGQSQKQTGFVPIGKNYMPISRENIFIECK